MDELLSLLPQFWRDAISAPETWSFWEWVGYSAAVIGILAFIRLLLKLVDRWAQRRIFSAVIWSIKQNLELIERLTGELAIDLEEALLWFKHPYRLTAWVVRAVIKSTSLLVIGLLAILTLPEIFNVLIGLPLVGISLLRLLYVRHKMLLAINCRKYVDKESASIERSVRGLEKLTVFDDALAKETIARANQIISRAKQIASDIDGGRSLGSDSEDDQDANEKPITVVGDQPLLFEELTQNQSSKP